MYFSDSQRTDPNTHDGFHLLDQEELVSSATFYPGSTEEVQQIVRWANEFEIPIYPISMGRNCKCFLGESLLAVVY